MLIIMCFKRGKKTLEDFETLGMNGQSKSNWDPLKAHLKAWQIWYHLHNVTQAGVIEQIAVILVSNKAAGWGLSTHSRLPCPFYLANLDWI